MTPATVRKRLSGLVVSDRMTKTLVVRVSRLVRHPVYQKVLRRSRKVKAHDPEGKAHTGDEVLIEEARHFSKDKRWRLVAVTRRRAEEEVAAG